MTGIEIVFDSIEVVRRSRRTDPATSKQAAARSAEFADTHMGKLVAALQRYGPLSPKQFMAFTGLSHIQADRRRAQLLEEGRIRILTDDSGQPVERDGCEVWMAV